MVDRIAVRLAAFALAIVASFGAAYGIGQAVGPVGDDHPAPAPAVTTPTTTMEHGGHS